MKKIMLLVMAAMLSITAVQANPFQDGKKVNKECCCPKCDEKCKKECGDKCKDGKCSKADCAKSGETKKDCCKKEKQS